MNPRRRRVRRAIRSNRRRLERFGFRFRTIYGTGTTPRRYVCGQCGASGCKLWREYQTFKPRLLCVDCALKDQNKDGPVDADGRRKCDDLPFCTYTIGWYVPAVPDEEGLGYWGYCAVPDAGLAWWRGLPTLVPCESGR